MTDSKYDPRQEARLQGFLNRVHVRNCIDCIISARGHLRELGSIGGEFQYGENNRLDLEKEIDSLLGEVSTAIEELQKIIVRSELDLPESPKIPTTREEEHWSLGAEDIRGPLIPILRGELEPVRRVVVAPGLPDGVFLLFLSIDGLKDLLVREVHGHWGYHYHYLDSKRRRSDTLLTFAPQLKTLPKGQQVRVLTWERHSEKSHFSARAGSWGEKKRQSVYQSCIGDSAKRHLSDFKTPGKNAETVWPI